MERCPGSFQGNLRGQQALGRPEMADVGLQHSYLNQEFLVPGDIRVCPDLSSGVSNWDWFSLSSVPTSLPIPRITV